MKKRIDFRLLLILLAGVAGNAQTNIYNSDGSLDKDRTVSQKGHYLNVIQDDNSNFFIAHPKYNGFVGINTVTPSERLEVVGNVKAKRGIMRYSPTNGTTYPTFA